MTFESGSAGHGHKVESNHHWDTLCYGEAQGKRQRHVSCSADDSMSCYLLVQSICLASLWPRIGRMHGVEGCTNSSQQFNVI